MRLLLPRYSSELKIDLINMYLGRATSRNFNLTSGSVKYKFRVIMPETFWLKLWQMCRADREVFDASSPYMFCTWCNFLMHQAPTCFVPGVIQYKKLTISNVVQCFYLLQREKKFFWWQAIPEMLANKLKLTVPWVGCNLWWNNHLGPYESM